MRLDYSHRLWMVNCSRSKLRLNRDHLWSEKVAKTGFSCHCAYYGFNSLAARLSRTLHQSNLFETGPTHMKLRTSPMTTELNAIVTINLPRRHWTLIWRTFILFIVFFCRNTGHHFYLTLFLVIKGCELDILSRQLNVSLLFNRPDVLWRKANKSKNMLKE